MNKLSQEKKNRLALVIFGTLAVVGLIWYGVIRPQQNKLNRLSIRKAKAVAVFNQMTSTIKAAEDSKTALRDSLQLLEKAEAHMASGDLYSWAINTIKEFKAPHRIDIPQFSQLDGPKNTTLLPQFPYKQASLTIGGTAHFFDFGRFVADMENQFPYLRLVNLTLEPATASSPDDPERLNFKMDVVMLVKPNNS